MARTNYGQAIRHVRTLFGVGTVGGLTDGQLLERFLAQDAEAAKVAFAALVERHGPMVLRVCRVVLGNEHDARDAFQASFLILIHKARTLRVRDSLGPWLHQVALRVASCARSAVARRRRHEQRAAEIAIGRRSDVGERDDLNVIVHEEIRRLPERYRRPIVLCCLEGLSREEAAGQLGWPLGTVQSRLARGRKRLRASLTRRGLAPSATLTGAVLGAEAARAAVPSEVIAPLVRAARLASGGSPMAEVISTGVLTLTKGVLKTMLMTHMKLGTATVLAIVLAATGMGVWASQTDGSRDESLARFPAQAAPMTAPIPEVVACVNGKPITLQDLMDRCLAKHGQKELQTLVALKLLDEACRKRGISVTDAECEAEAARVAKTFGGSKSDWYRTLSEQRGISKKTYLQDIISPQLKMRRLGIEPKTFNGLEGLRRAVGKLDGMPNIEVFLGQSADRSELGTRMPPQTQEDRLKAVEQSLEQILKTLDELKRTAEDSRH